VVDVRRLRTPRLDFIVIGAQKAGTTSLWRYLDDNEELVMPPQKEASFFSEPEYPDELRGYMRALFSRAPAGTKLGKVTPAYMHGNPAAPVALIAERIAETVPGVKLVALLRDPVERAYSAHRMLVRRGSEQRSFGDAVRELLAPEAIERARAAPDPSNSYIAAGEYGRMLSLYLERFPREQLHVELSVDLDHAPGAVIERVCTFLGVRPHEPAHLDQRFFQGGRPLISGQAEGELKAYFERNVWPRMRHGDQHRLSFEQWFELWNVAPEAPAESVDAATEALLREHYAEDERLLEAATGVRVPRDR
jgi:hypothetical protein